MRFVLVAGEASGDLLGASLIDDLRAIYPKAQFVGIGGEKMRGSGMDIWWDCAQLSHMGLIEVLRHLPSLLRLRRQLIARTQQFAPDMYIGIDAPDFNLGVENSLQRVGIQTVHYVSPSVWAWRRGRLKKIAASTKRMLCMFPFEPAYYSQHGVDAQFVGHPLTARLSPTADPLAARALLGLPLSGPVLALMPGSRMSEIKRLAAVFFAVGTRLRLANPKLTIVVPAATSQCRIALERQLRPEHQLIIFDGQAHLILQACDAVLLASGTAALEAALCNRPLVVAYKLNGLTHAIVKIFGLLKVKYFSLPNVIAERCVVPEFAQDQVTVDNLVGALTPLMQHHSAQSIAQRTAFAMIRSNLQSAPKRNAANVIATWLADSSR
jgi:lipid-A-disaccharide synthase